MDGCLARYQRTLAGSAVVTGGSFAVLNIAQLHWAGTAANGIYRFYYRCSAGALFIDFGEKPMHDLPASVAGGVWVDLTATPVQVDYFAHGRVLFS